MTKQEFEKKTIFVLMSTFNGEKYLNEQIESIKDQKNVETHLVIRDDGSKDNTKNIIKNGLILILIGLLLLKARILVLLKVFQNCFL